MQPSERLRMWLQRLLIILAIYLWKVFVSAQLCARAGFVGANTLHKTISTTFFLYFACILPAIALGVLNYNNTGGLIGTAVLLRRPIYKTISALCHRRNNHRDRGRLVPQFLGWGPTMYWSPQLLGRSFQKARNFTASSHQNARFRIWVCKNFPGVIAPDPHSGKGWPPPASNTQLGLWPARGASAQVLGPKRWSPELFSRCCAAALCRVSKGLLTINNIRLNKTSIRLPWPRRNNTGLRPV